MSDKIKIATCSKCGSTDVLRDAWAAQNLTTGKWELCVVFDGYFCDECAGDCSITIQERE